MGMKGGEMNRKLNCPIFENGGIILGDNKMDKKEYQSHNGIQNEIGETWSIIIAKRNVICNQCA